MSRLLQLAALSSAAMVLAAVSRPPSQAATQGRDSSAAISSASGASDVNGLVAAVCPVVYQLDESPGNRGYHYVFYGNAFFINRDGYLLTAAHVLSEFHNGGQPSILLRQAAAPPRLVKATIIAMDVDHDVAVLRATPNPFNGPYAVVSLPLTGEKPVIGESVETTALRPSRMKDPHTFELPIADSYPALVSDYRRMVISPESKTAQAPVGPSDPQVFTDLFLFSHEVQRGQSGAPVTSAATHAVVGIIEGRWLHPAGSSLTKTARGASPPSPSALTQGAAIPIPYATALLQRNHVLWSTAPARF